MASAEPRLTTFPEGRQAFRGIAAEQDIHDPLALQRQRILQRQIEPLPREALHGRETRPLRPLSSDASSRARSRSTAA